MICVHMFGKPARSPATTKIDVSPNAKSLRAMHVRLAMTAALATNKIRCLLAELT